MSTSRDPVFDTRLKPGFLHPRHWPTWTLVAISGAGLVSGASA